MNVKFEPCSPDGLPIQPALCDTREEAERVIARFVERFRRIQGYYADSRGNRLPVDEIAGACTIGEVDPATLSEEEDEEYDCLVDHEREPDNVSDDNWAVGTLEVED